MESPPIDTCTAGSIQRNFGIGRAKRQRALYSVGDAVDAAAVVECSFLVVRVALL